MSAKHKLHTFQVKTSTVQDKDLLGNRCHFRHLQHFCSSRAVILLTFLEDNAQNSPSYFSSNILEILLSYSPILKTMASDQTREANKNMWVICRKRGQHSLVYCAESQIEFKQALTEVSRSASPCNVAHKYFWSGFRTLFKAFLKTKTRL